MAFPKEKRVFSSHCTCHPSKPQPSHGFNHRLCRLTPWFMAPFYFPTCFSDFLLTISLDTTPLHSAWSVGTQLVAHLVPHLSYLNAALKMVPLLVFFYLNSWLHHSNHPLGTKNISVFTLHSSYSSLFIGYQGWLILPSKWQANHPLFQTSNFSEDSSKRLTFPPCLQSGFQTPWTMLVALKEWSIDQLYAPHPEAC